MDLTALRPARPLGGEARRRRTTTRSRPWPLALLLAVVVAVLGAASAGGDRHTSERHDAAVTAYTEGTAALAPTRSPGRLLADHPHTGNHADAVPCAVAPRNWVHPVPRAPTGHLADHDGPPPRTRLAPSTGDRAPPSH